MARLARVGDLIDHGGVIITGSLDRISDNVGTARVGDLVICDIHHTQVIITGSLDVKLDNVGVARVGDVCSCGAVIITGSLDIEVD